MPATVVILRSQKPAVRRNRLLFINAVDEVSREQAQSFLREEHQRKILAAYEAFADDDGFAAVATIDQIADKDYSLAIPLYVTATAASEAHDEITVKDALAEWRHAADIAETAVDDVVEMLRKAVSR